jgi:hypothetical protein
MREGKTDASPQAQDFTLKHPAPSIAVEGGHPDASYMYSVQGEASRTHGMPYLRHVRQAAGP